MNTKKLHISLTLTLVLLTLSGALALLVRAVTAQEPPPAHRESLPPNTTTQPGSVQAQTWYTETVDSTGDVGWYTSLALDASHYPHISYYDFSNKDLKYAWYNGSGWYTETVDSNGDVGKDTSLALDAAGHPHISYYDDSNDDLKYAWYDGSAWYTETVDSSRYVGTDTSLALDTAGHPHISYHDFFNGDLKYAWYDGSDWYTETVASSGFASSHTSLALDSSNHPHISYHGDSNGALDGLMYAWYDGSGWYTETVDYYYPGNHTSLALDAMGHPHISYCAYHGGDLKYAWYDGSAWHLETVDSIGYVGEYTSLALDAAGQPHISYYDASIGHQDLKYAWYDGSAWHLETVDSAGDVGEYTSLALDSSGRLHISYYDAGYGDLKYAWVDAGPITQNITPGAGGTLTYTDPQGNATTVDVPPGAVSQPISLTYTAQFTLTHAAPVNLNFAGHSFALDAYRGGVLQPGFVFSTPLTITIHYSDADVAGMDENDLTLDYWDKTASQWVDAATTCDPASVYDRHPDENWLAAPICHLSEFALFGTGKNFIYLPLALRNYAP